MAKRTLTKLTEKNVPQVIRELQEMCDQIGHELPKMPKRIELATGRISQKKATKKQSRLIMTYAKKVLGRKPTDPDIFGIVDCGGKLEKYGGRYLRLVAEVFDAE